MENKFDHWFDLTDSDHEQMHYHAMRNVLENGEGSDYEYYLGVARNHTEFMKKLAKTRPDLRTDITAILKLMKPVPAKIPVR